MITIVRVTRFPKKPPAGCVTVRQHFRKAKARRKGQTH